MSQVRWLVAGIGDITTKRVIPAIQAEPLSSLYGLVTRTLSKAEPYGVKAWDDFAAAIADPHIDAVYVATPVVHHAAQTIAALVAGKHVLCEKPMAMNHAEAVSMQCAAEETGRTFGIAYYRRMYPKVRRAKQLLAEGVIGRPVLAEINCQGWFEVVDGFRGWVVEPEMAGGGPLYDIASHRIDILNYLFGRPSRVTGQLSNVVHQTRVEDSATLLVEYENLVRGVVDVRWHSRVDRDEFRIIGTDGAIELTPLSGPTLRYPGGEEQLPCHGNVHYPCVENFVDALTGKAELAASGASSLWTDWVTEQVMRRAVV
ncbi:MAG: Gfo/Idh/MocA family oxidoreductase [Acidimicrobiia bacterium]|nr:Gfo/Idh/MocA family oxidoreductase [Acidimicrobiia bacterium]